MKRMTVHLNMPADLALPLLGLIGFLIGTALDGDGIYDGWTGAIGFMGGQFVLLGILWMRRDRRADAADGPMSA